MCQYNTNTPTNSYIKMHTAYGIDKKKLICNILNVHYSLQWYFQAPARTVDLSLYFKSRKITMSKGKSCVQIYLQEWQKLEKKFGCCTRSVKFQCPRTIIVLMKNSPSAKKKKKKMFTVTCWKKKRSVGFIFLKYFFFILKFSEFWF
jgi:hypothetical protein